MTKDNSHRICPVDIRGCFRSISPFDGLAFETIEKWLCVLCDGCHEVNGTERVAKSEERAVG